MHDWPEAQSVIMEHWGAASCAVTQTPARQKTPEQPGPQSESVSQAVRQTAFTHSQVAGQSALEWHCGCAPMSGSQTPSTQTSCAGQLAVVWQSGWQNPFAH